MDIFNMMFGGGMGGMGGMGGGDHHHHSRHRHHHHHHQCNLYHLPQHLSCHNPQQILLQNCPFHYIWHGMNVSNHQTKIITKPKSITFKFTLMMILKVGGTQTKRSQWFTSWE